MQDFCLDSKYICCSTNKTIANDTKLLQEYIIFLNVRKAIYTNFKITSDMSLETAAEYIYDNVRCTIKGKSVQKPQFSECTNFIESDKNNSIAITLHPQAKIIVVRTLFPNEHYYQRIGGYIDFEHRLCPDYCVQEDDRKRARSDREYEINLLDGLT